MSKKVSVIMGIYNCENTLTEALDSIINQKYSNWEIIMCDDGSADNTVQIAEGYAKKYPNRIKLLKNERNRGLNYTLNRCLMEATGEYIARMDGDDISCADRFEKEVDALDKNPDIAIVSTDMIFFDQFGEWGKTNVRKFPQKINFLKSTPFCHAACMVRREAYMAVDGYSVSKKLLRVEDYHLWVRMYEAGYNGMNIQEVLYMMRDDRDAQSRRKFKYRINESYVKGYAVKHLKLPIYGYLYCLVPILVGLIPNGLYKILHRKKQSG